MSISKKHKRLRSSSYSKSPLAITSLISVNMQRNTRHSMHANDRDKNYSKRCLSGLLYRLSAWVLISFMRSSSRFFSIFTLKIMYILCSLNLSRSELCLKLGKFWTCAASDSNCAAKAIKVICETGWNFQPPQRSMHFFLLVNSFFGFRSEEPAHFFFFCRWLHSLSTFTTKPTVAR